MFFIITTEDVVYHVQIYTFCNNTEDNVVSCVRVYVVNLSDVP